MSEDQTATERWSRGRIVGAAVGAVLALAVTVFLILGLMRGSTPSRLIDNAVRDGKPYTAPDFTLPVFQAAGGVGPEGSPLRLSSLRGRPVVLNFWASWCDTCPEEAPNLARLWDRYGKRGVVVLGVNSQNDPPKARAFLSQYKLRFANVREGDDAVARRYGVAAMPETFLIDPDGMIRVLPIRGALNDAIEEQIAAHLDQVLAS